MPSPITVRMCLPCLMELNIQAILGLLKSGPLGPMGGGPLVGAGTSLYIWLMKSSSNSGILDIAVEGVLSRWSCRYFMPYKFKIASGGSGRPACCSHISHVSECFPIDLCVCGGGVILVQDTTYRKEAPRFPRDRIIDD